jgi:hypothetical protein
MGSSHYVLPALYSCYERHNLLPLIPDDLTGHLRQIYQLNLQRNLKIMDQCREIESLLHSIGTEPVFLKGAGFLVSGLYKDTGDRMMEDIDILLPLEDIPKTISRLREAGYKTYEDPQVDEIYRKHYHMPPMFHPDRPAAVEIHHSPLHPRYAAILSSPEILKEANLFNTIRTPNFRQCQLLTFLHEHFHNRGNLSFMPSLKGAFDFYLLAKLRPPQPADVPQGRFRKQYERFRYCVRELFNTPEITESNGALYLSRYWKKQLFLLNHPGWDAFYHDYLYAAAIFTGLLISSLWSITSRRLVGKKVRNVLQREVKS